MRTLNGVSKKQAIREASNPAGRLSVRPDIRAAPVSSEAKKKTRGVGGAAAPRLNPSRGGSGRAKPPRPKFGGSGGQRPPAKTEDF